MKIQILKPSETEKAAGVVVVIDVLRAFSTACYLFSKNALRIRIVGTPQEAFALKKQNANYILVGERGGLKISHFDYGNSPYEVQQADFSKKTIIMTTSMGTRVLHTLRARKDIPDIITGSFVNAHAITKYIKNSKENTISFICTDDSHPDNEDFQLANYIKNTLENKNANFTEIKSFLMEHPSSYGFLQKPLTKHSKQDFHLSLELDKFDFVLKVNQVNDEMYLERI